MTVKEKTNYVFGQSFAQYNSDDLEEVIWYFKKRLEENNIDLSVFKDAVCLDAGCGSGRGTILMCMLGAKEVYAIDQSSANCNTTRVFAKKKDFPVTVINGSLLNLKNCFPDEMFDIVWCNGVLHHTTAPLQGLKELKRVLKPKGYMWLYLYGSGGIYWYVVDQIREQLKDFSAVEVFEELRKLGLPAIQIAEYMDDWKVPIIEKYRAYNIEEILCEQGFSFRRCYDGVEYDTCSRIKKFGEYKLMGEGDLRYWCRKDIETDFIDTSNMYSEEVEELKITFPKENLLEFCADLQSKIRYEMNQNEPFNMNTFQKGIK